MNMIILTKEQVEKINEINAENVHLSRAISPVSLKDETHAVTSAILDDEGTWRNWIEFLSVLPQRDVSEDEIGSDNEVSISKK